MHNEIKNMLYTGERQMAQATVKEHTGASTGV